MRVVGQRRAEKSGRRWWDVCESVMLVVGQRRAEKSGHHWWDACENLSRFSGITTKCTPVTAGMKNKLILITRESCRSPVGFSSPVPMQNTTMHAISAVAELLVYMQLLATRECH